MVEEVVILSSEAASWSEVAHWAISVFLVFLTLTGVLFAASMMIGRLFFRRCPALGRTLSASTRVLAVLTIILLVAVMVLIRAKIYSERRLIMAVGDAGRETPLEGECLQAAALLVDSVWHQCMDFGLAAMLLDKACQNGNSEACRASERAVKDRDMCVKARP